MKDQATEVPYLRQLVWGVAAILLGSCGIAAVMVRMPTQIDVAAVVVVLDKLRASPVSSVDAHARNSPARAVGDARVRVKCGECGGVGLSR